MRRRAGRRFFEENSQMSRLLEVLALVAIVVAGPAGLIAGMRAAESGKFVELAACLGVIVAGVTALVVIRAERRRRAIPLPSTDNPM